MKPGQDLIDVITGVLQDIKPVLAGFKPDVVLVHSDTATTFATSLAAPLSKSPLPTKKPACVPTTCIRPGQRKGTGASPTPWPPCISLPQPPDNLLKEGTDPACIFTIGNTVIDALLEVVRKLENPALKVQFGYLSANRRLVLVTGHRRESFGGSLERIFQALIQTARQFPQVDVV